MKTLINIIKNITLLVAILISLKITWLAGYLYLKMPIGLIFKILCVSDENAHLYLWQYLPMNFEIIDLNANQITLLSIPFTNVFLMQTIVISWICYLLIKKNKPTYFFIKPKKQIIFEKNKNIYINLVLSFLFGCYVYNLQDVLTLTYNSNEILEVLKPTYFLFILQLLIGYNILVHGITMWLIFQHDKWNLFTKSVISILLMAFFIIITSSLDMTLLWKEGGISIFLNKKPIEEQSLYLTDALHGIYHYYGLKVSFCNPEILNPCLEIKRQVEHACHLKDSINQFPIYGRSLSSNLAGQAPALLVDQHFGCSGMKKVLQDCIDKSMQDNFVRNWNLRHNPVISYHVPRDPIIIKLPKL